MTPTKMGPYLTSVDVSGCAARGRDKEDVRCCGDGGHGSATRNRRQSEVSRVAGEGRRGRAMAARGRGLRDIGEGASGAEGVHRSPSVVRFRDELREGWDQLRARTPSHSGNSIRHSGRHVITLLSRVHGVFGVHTRLCDSKSRLDDWTLGLK